MIKTIFWDFDGVILDSMPIRDAGFREIFKEYPLDIVEKFIEYHQYNAGLSRFVKIKYFYNQLLHEEVLDEKIEILANSFSKIMKKELIDKKYLIEESIEFIKENYKKYNFHIVSGSEEKELNYLCEMLNIDKYFKTINGSPRHKNDLVKHILNEEHYEPEVSILIGDSITDYNAAMANSLRFYGFNNRTLIPKSEKYIYEFKTF